MKRGRPDSAIFPTEPLRFVARARAVKDGTNVQDLITSILTPSQARAFWRPRVGWRLADELACALGHHPCNIWPYFDKDVETPCPHPNKFRGSRCRSCYNRDGRELVA